MTTSTLAGEYVTARGYVGGRASGGKFRDEYFLYETRDKGEAMLDDVRVVEEGAADYGARGRYDPPKLWISLFSFVFLLLCPGKGGTEVDTSAGRLSEAKTQRRPTARERESEGRGVSFGVCCFCIFL